MNSVDHILCKIFLDPLAIQSNLARKYDFQIAAAASMGLITTRIRSCDYGRKWRLTEMGMAYLRDQGLL